MKPFLLSEETLESVRNYVAESGNSDSLKKEHETHYNALLKHHNALTISMNKYHEAISSGDLDSAYEHKKDIDQHAEALRIGSVNRGETSSASVDRTHKAQKAQEARAAGKLYVDRKWMTHAEIKALPGWKKKQLEGEFTKGTLKQHAHLLEK